MRASSLVIALGLSYGCQRPGHGARSYCTEIDACVVRLICTRGKRSRRAYRWVIPRYGVTGLDVGKRIWDSWLAACDVKKALVTTIFVDSRGSAINPTRARQDVQEIMAAKQVGSAGAFTLQSVRRFLPSVAAMWRAPWDERVELGCWSTSRGDKQISTMPHTYSASKLQTQAFAKLVHTSVMKQMFENGDLPTMSAVPRLIDTVDVAAIRTKVASSLEASLGKGGKA